MKETFPKLPRSMSYSSGAGQIFVVLVLILILIIFIFVSLISRGGSSQPKQVETTPTSPVFSVGPIFGAQVVQKVAVTPTSMDLIKNMGIKVTTLWIYPHQNGGFNAPAEAQRVDRLKEETGGLDVYVHIMPNTQSEAHNQSNTETGDPELPGGGFKMPVDMATYLGSVKQLASALKGKVKYYSIGNEFSGLTWQGSVEDYGKLLSETGKTIKSVNPDAVILDSGMAGQIYLMTITKTLYDEGKTQEAIDFVHKYEREHIGRFQIYLPIDNESQLNSFLTKPEVIKSIQMSDERFKEYCSFYDIFELHFYQPWDNLEQVYDWIHDQMTRNNCVKPIQVWELGYGPDKNIAYDINIHAQSVVKLLTISAGKGAQTIIYFPLTEKGARARGLLSRDGQPQAPSIAYQVTTSKLTSTTSAERLDLGDGVWAYKFGRSSGDVYVVWSTSPKTITLPITSLQVTVTDIGGKTSTADPKILTVSNSPIFVETAP